MRNFLFLLILVSSLSCATKSNSERNVSDWIPFLYEKNHIILPLDVKGQKLRALLDSGANINIIGLAFGKKYLMASKQKVEVTTLNVTKKVPLYESVLFSFHDAKIRQPALGLELVSSNFDAVIGSSIFRMGTWEVDFPRRQFRIHKASSFVYTGPTKPIPIEMKQGNPYVHLSVDGRTYTLLLDTGATGSLLLPASSKEIQQLKNRGQESSRLVGAHGEGLETYTKPAGEIEIGSYKLNGVVANYFDEDTNSVREFGIMGLQFLDQFVVTIDLAHGALYLELQEESQAAAVQ